MLDLIVRVLIIYCKEPFINNLLNFLYLIKLLGNNFEIVKKYSK